MPIIIYRAQHSKTTGYAPVRRVFFAFGVGRILAILGSATNILNKSACVVSRVELPRPS